MNIHREKKEKRARRHKRIRARVKGTAEVPRLSVFRSNKHIYGQVIDDAKCITLAASKDDGKGTKVEKARAAGKALAERALAKKVTRVAFDRGGIKYAGRVKALAEGAREGGLTF